MSVHTSPCAHTGCLSRQVCLCVHLGACSMSVTAGRVGDRVDPSHACLKSDTLPPGGGGRPGNDLTSDRSGWGKDPACQAGLLAPGEGRWLGPGFLSPNPLDARAHPRHPCVHASRPTRAGASLGVRAPCPRAAWGRGWVALPAERCPGGGEPPQDAAPGPGQLDPQAGRGRGQEAQLGEGLALGLG